MIDEPGVDDLLVANSEVVDSGKESSDEVDTVIESSVLEASEVEASEADSVVEDDKDDVGVVAGGGGRQCPFPSGNPLTHLQSIEHSFPSTPFNSPLSHSSPSAGCHWSPHTAGPRVKMNGTPELPSPKVIEPGPVAPFTMATGTKGFTPELG